MARRPLRCLAAVLLAFVAACSAGGEAAPATADSTTGTSALPAPTTTSTALTATSTAPPPSSPAPKPEEVDAVVTVPDGEGPFPAVVLVHGGGWVTGDPSIMRPLAEHLNDNGFLTVNTRYNLATRDGGAFPQAADDVACAVRYAAAHPDSDGSVALVGHSAGAHIGALVALMGDDYRDGCTLAGSGLPDRFVGLAGPYDISRVALATALFGGGPDQLPEIWEAGNPQRHTDANPDLDSLIMYGERDGLVTDRFAIEFNNALTNSGSQALLEMVEGARHNHMHDPDLVGDLIVTWLER